ncbi:MAG: response regulator transcription factor [Dehalococcoidales bacterium]|nr:response regulator transcription factor [Dehalococcoidales bacterium]
MHKPLILIVDDDPVIAKFVRANMEANNYATTTTVNGSEALKSVERELPDLILLDIMMPEMDGFEVCRRLREWSQVPIIMLTARGDEQDKVKCLEMGADDYIAKPFGVKELIARVGAVLRRTGSKSTAVTQPSFTYGEIEINFIDRNVKVAGKEIKLTPIEYNLLQELALNAGKVLTHTHLLQKVWGPEYQDERQYLHVFIRRLRSKLEPNIDKPTFIITVPAIGYQIKHKE